MRSIQLTKPGEVSFVDMPEPEPGDDEVLIAVKYLGLCGSDLHMFHGSYRSPHKYPVVPGHEWSGTIVKTGKRVTAFQAGQNVTGDAAMWCGTCANCVRDKNMCVSINKRGLTLDGYAAEKIVLHQKHLYRIPEKVPFEVAAINEAFAVSMRAIHKGMGKDPREFAGRKALVLGGGPLGMGVAMLLIRHFGFEDVFVDDLSPHRVDLAERIGAKKFPGMDGDTATPKSYREMYEMDGYDFVFESTGVNDVLDRAFLYVNPLGTVVSLAPISDIRLRGALLVLKSARLVGSLGGTGDFEEVLAAFAEDPEYYKQIISHCFAMEQIAEAFAVQQDDPTRMKILLKIS